LILVNKTMIRIVKKALVVLYGVMLVCMLLYAPHVVFTGRGSQSEFVGYFFIWQQETREMGRWDNPDLVRIFLQVAAATVIFAVVYLLCPEEKKKEGK
jgi:hypothetical protein